MVFIKHTSVKPGVFRSAPQVKALHLDSFVHNCWHSSTLRTPWRGGRDLSVRRSASRTTSGHLLSSPARQQANDAIMPELSLNCAGPLMDLRKQTFVSPGVCRAAPQELASQPLCSVQSRWHTAAVMTSGMLPTSRPLATSLSIICGGHPETCCHCNCSNHASRCAEKILCLEASGSTESAICETSS